MKVYRVRVEVYSSSWCEKVGNYGWYKGNNTHNYVVCVGGTLNRVPNEIRKMAMRNAILDVFRNDFGCIGLEILVCANSRSSAYSKAWGIFINNFYKFNKAES